MKILKTIFSFSMIAILMLSTLGFSVSRHYCMGMLVEESFYSPSDGCSDMSEDDCGSGFEMDDKGCCDDETLAVEGIQVISFLKKQVEFSPVIIYPSGLCAFQSLPEDQNTYQKLSFFPPPEPQPYGRGLLVKVQRFLI